MKARLNYQNEPWQAETMNSREAISFLKAIGYEIEPHMTCYGLNYKSVSVREIDSKVNAFHYQDARRDKNFYALQNFRYFTVVRERSGRIIIF